MLPSKSKNTFLFFDCFNTEKIVNTATYPKSIINSFNKFFCTLCKNLEDNIPQSDSIQNFSNYLFNRVSDSIFLKSPSSTEIKSKSNLSLYSLNYVEACYEFAGPISASLHPGNTAPIFRRNVTAVASRWQHCVQFERSEI